MALARWVPEFRDKRLSDRFGEIRRDASARPGVGFPQMVRGESEREALYRFLRNGRVSHTVLIEPHVEATAARMRERPLVIVAHDTSEFSFSGESRRPGLGDLPNGQGFLGHFALAVDPADRLPLGICGVETIFRDGKLGASEARRRASDRESLRWYRLAARVEELTQHSAIIHLMDRDADTYGTLANLVGDGSRFVVRQKHDRAADVGLEDLVSLMEHAATAPTMLEREVKLSRRSARRPLGPRTAHPPREGRTARLAVAAVSAAIHRPKKRAGKLPESLDINVVRVWETEPPPGEEGVEWYLLTTEPIETPEQVAAIVDYYRLRWLIEEFFKALKTGCSFEKRQLENRSSILTALGLFVPIAWKMLLLRGLSRDRAGRSATASEVLTAIQRRVLEARLRRRLPEKATAADALSAIAQLGGHIKSNGPPGWQVIGRGYEELLLLEAGWCAALGLEGSDQS